MKPLIKDILALIAAIVVVVGSVFVYIHFFQSPQEAFGAVLRVCTIPEGCTGTSTRPTFGQVLVGDGTGQYTLTATSSLGITGGGGAGTAISTSTPGSGLHLSSTNVLNSAAAGVNPNSLPQLQDFFHESMDSGWSSFYTGSPAHDSSVFTEGNASILLPGNGTSNVGMRKNITDTSFANGAFHFWVRSDDWTNVTDAEILVSTSGVFDAFYILDLKDFIVSPQNNGWIEVVATKSNFSVGGGSPNWATANDVIVRMRSSAATTPNFWFDGFGVNRINTKPVISIVFDDGWADTATTAKPIMDQYGYKGTAYVIPSALGTAPTYMVQSQVEDLHIAGWDIAGHGDVNLTTLTAAQAEADLRLTKAYLVDHGYRGGNLYAWPNGAVTEALASTTAKYFDVARNVTWLAQSANYVSPSQLNAVSPTVGTATSTLYTMVDNAVANNDWLIFTFHHITAAGVGSDHFSTLKFTDLMGYINSKGVEVLPVSKVLAKDYTPTDGYVNDWRVSDAALTPTSTLGVHVAASSTIGSGTQAGGLTISGGATTTGFLTVQGATSTFANSIVMDNGQYIAATGTTNAPAFSFTGDRRTGFYNSSTNVVSFVTAGSIRFAYGNTSVFSLGVPIQAGLSGTETAVAMGSQDTPGTGMFFPGSGQALALSATGRERMRFMANGYTGVGTTSPFALFSIHASSSATSTTLFAIASSTSAATSTHLMVKNTGAIFAPNIATNVTANGVCITASGEITNAGAAACIPSGRQYKENETPIPSGKALSIINKLTPKTFNYKPELGIDTQTHYGLIAQDVAEVDDSLVARALKDGQFEKKGEPLTLHFENFTGLFVQALQELDARSANTYKSLTDKWQNGLLALLIVYVIYNEWDKRKRKKIK